MWLSFWGTDRLVVQQPGRWQVLSWPDGEESATGTGTLYPRPGKEEHAVLDAGRITVNGAPAGAELVPGETPHAAELAWGAEEDLLVVTGWPEGGYRPGPSLLPVPRQGCTAQRFGSFPAAGQELWRVPLAGGAPQRLFTANGIQKIGRPTVLPGHRVAFSLWDPPLYGAPARFRLVEVTAPGQVTDLFPQLAGAVHWPGPSPDGQSFAFWHSPADPPFPPWYRLVIRAGDDVWSPFPAGLQLLPDAAWSPDGTFIGTRIARGIGTGIGAARLPEAGWEWLGPATGHVSSFALAPGGEQAAAVRETESTGPGLYLLGRRGIAVPFGRAAPPAARPYRPRLVRWTSGTVTCEGLFASPQARAGHRAPTVVTLDGPVSLAATMAGLDQWCQAGYAAFAPSYRSTGIGGQDAMRAALRATDDPPGRSDAQDVLSGVDQLIREGVADPADLYLFGHGYGGYLANRIVTIDRRFRAAAVWDGYADTRLCYCLDGGGGGSATTRQLYGGTPWEQPRRYLDTSPVADAGQVSTPMLLLGGDTQTAEPIAWFTALRAHGVAAELYFYRGEGEGPYRPANARDVRQRTVSWFRQHARQP